ncbi:hypothetical protein [Rhizobium laguerreae]|uniref:hypothetical protein n=1 Tax=Rhizobium laguerreae TaxID=1076926 RepID=UPI001C8FC4FC|nr:hypothetical protein [Rhizobium laguerreae]MBY3036964.1 hypothetical protein [Rhizobium laguerreae]
MLQAKLFIICNQASMQTDARVEGSIPFKAEDASGSVERLEPGEVVKCTAVKCEYAVPQELGAKPNDWSEPAEIDGNDLNGTVRAARKHFEQMT